MQQRPIVRIGVPLAVAALALSACGSRGDTGSASGGTAGGASTKTAKIGVIAPLSGDLSALGKGIQHSVELAVKQANDTNAIPGWKISVEAVDDEGKPDVGKNAATKLASDAQVIGVVAVTRSFCHQVQNPCAHGCGDLRRGGRAAQPVQSVVVLLIILRVRKSRSLLKLMRCQENSFKLLKLIS